MSSERHRLNSVESRFAEEDTYRQTKDFHEEMTETCLDMMARYSFSSCSSQPKRTQAMDFLLANGDSQSWLIGNVLITITTSLSDPESCPACSLARSRTPHANNRSLLQQSSSISSELPPVLPDAVPVPEMMRLGVALPRLDLSGATTSEDGRGVGGERRSSGDQLTPIATTTPSSMRRIDGEVFTSASMSSVEPSAMPLLDRLSLQATSAKDAEVSFSPSQQMLFSRQSSVADSCGATTPSNDHNRGRTTSPVNVQATKPPALSHSTINNTKATTQLVAVVKPSSASQRQTSFEDSPVTMTTSQSRPHTADSSSQFSSSSSPMTALSRTNGTTPICRCCLEGWAEVVVRRPSGNTSWMMRLENMPTPSDYSAIVNDVVALCSTMADTKEHNDVMTAKNNDIPGDAPAMLSTKESSDVLRSVARNVAPSVASVRRRFSTGSLDIPCELKMTSTSPDMETVQDAYNNMKQALEFNRPLVGLSPISTATAFDLDDRQALQDPPPSRSRNELSSAPTTPVAVRADDSSMELLLARNTTDAASTTDGLPVAAARRRVPSPRRSRATRQLAFVNRKSWHSSDNENPKEPSSSKPNDAVTHSIDADDMMSSSAEAQRKRCQTVSIPIRATASGAAASETGWSADPPAVTRSLVNPSFVFLQLYYSSFVSGCSLRPILLDGGEVVRRAVKVLDRIPPFDTHKIGVLYVGPHQASDEAAILSNQFGSSRYVRFLANLGTLIKLTDCSQTEVYTGGLDRNGTDGDFAYSWRDDSTQVIFHAATLMPNRPSDPACNSKKLHIGNNFVTVVYNDSGDDYSFGTIKGQFNFAEIVITPLDVTSSVVTVRVKNDVEADAIDTTPHVISDDGLALLVRQLAIHTNMATVLEHSRKRPGNAFGCNRLERLRQLKKIQDKSLCDRQGPCSPSVVTPVTRSSSRMFSFNNDEMCYVDFTEFT